MRARSAALGALVAGALGASTSTGGSASPIEYIIVVMVRALRARLRRAPESYA